MKETIPLSTGQADSTANPVLRGWSVQGARCAGQKAAPERNLSHPHHTEPITRQGAAPATTYTLEGHSPGGTG